ncbi:MAG: tetratricopeptide repeat protein [Lysobacteraceae bacterium]
MRYHFAGFVFDADNLSLIGPQGEHTLRPMSARVLQSLLDGAPNLMRHDELIDQVWGNQAVTPGVLTHSIREIRNALGDVPQQPRFIETRHRLGYRFIAPVRMETRNSQAAPVAASMAVSSATPGIQPESSEPHETPPTNLPAMPTTPSPRRWWWAVLSLLLLAGTLLWLRSQPFAPETTGTGLAIVAAGQPHEPEARHWYQQGLAALHAGDPGQAREWLERSRAREPEAVATLSALARAAAQSGAITRARAWMAAAEHAASTLPRVEQLRIAAYSAALDYRWDDAVTHLTAVSQLDPGDAETALHLFDAQLAQGRLREAAATLEAVAAQPLPVLDEWRVAMAQARLAEARGDHPARLEAAIAAQALARTPAQRLQSRLQQAGAQLLLGHPDETRLLLADMPEADDGQAPDIHTLRAEKLRAILLREEGDYAAAQTRLEHAATAARALGQDEMAARAQRQAAFVQIHAGQAEQAITRLRPLIEALETQGNIRELANARDVLALALQHSGDMPAALLASEAALAAYVQAGDRLGEASARNQLGMLYGRTGRDDESREQFELALRLFESAGERRGTALAQSNLAILDGRVGRREAARERNLLALAAFRELASWPDVARLQFNLAVQDRGSGRLPEARARFAEALEAFERIGSTDHTRQARASLAELLLAQARLDEAAQSLESDPDPHAGSPQPRAALLTAHGRLAALRGDIESAQSAFRSARELREAAGLPDWVRMSELDLAELAARAGQLARAEQAARQLRRDMTEAGDAHAAIQAGLLLAAVLERQREGAAASRLLEQLEAELIAHPDAMASLRLDLLRVMLRERGRTELATQVAAAARAIGYELLALRADLLAGGDAGRQALEVLERQGIGTEGVPPLLLY